MIDETRKLQLKLAPAQVFIIPAKKSQSNPERTTEQMITASTPTFSADKAKLPPNTTVSTIEGAREAAAAWDI